MKRDVAVAVGCWAVAGALLVLGPFVDAADPAVTGVPVLGSGLWWSALLVLSVQAASLVWCRHRPLTVLVAVSCGTPLLAALGCGDATSLGVAAVVVAVWSAVWWSQGPRLLAGLVVAGLLLALGTYAGQTAGLDTGAAVVAALVQGAGTTGLAAFGAGALRARREVWTVRTDLADAVDREHSALVAAAIAQERVAMARELHDIAAHHLTGIAVMTGAVERQIDTDPAGAKAAVRQVRAQSTSMLRELRGLVGLLRTAGSESGEVAGEESLAGIERLVEAARAAGRDVRLARRGPEPDGVGPLAQLSAYRTVQEALSNAARHAPGAACEVIVDARDPAAVVVVVRNGPPAQRTAASARTGVGLVGMRERAELTDAEFDAGASDDGGWQVRLRIPAATPAEVGA